MSVSRRSFLNHSAAFGFLSTLLAHSELGAALDTPSMNPVSQPTAGELYWKNLYAGPGSTKRGNQMPDQDRDPRIVYCGDKNEMIWVEDIKAADLPDFSDDAVVTLELTGFRSGSEDKAKLAKVRFSQLHLSCQRVTGSEFLGPLVWATLATLYAGTPGKLPAPQSLTWSALMTNPMVPAQPAQPQTPQLTHVVLNQGAGHMSVNITTTPENSVLDKVLGVLINGTKILTPLLGFPGIALPALQNFYTFYGQIEKARSENFLLNSAKMDVAVTQRGADSSLISANAMKLLTGNYILIPKSQEDDLQKDMDKLVVHDGNLVYRDSNLPPDKRVDEAVPTISYLTLNVKVQKASDFPATSTVTDPMLDSISPPTSSSDNKQTPAKKAN